MSNMTLNAKRPLLGAGSDEVLSRIVADREGIIGCSMMSKRTSRR